MLIIIAAIMFVVGLVLAIIAFVRKTSIKRPLIVIGASIVVFVVGVVVSGIDDSRQQAEAAEQARVAKVERKKLDKKFNAAHSELIAASYIAATSSEELADKVHDTWGNAIFDDGGATVAGKKYTDFTEAVNALIASESETVSKISNSEDTMNSALSDMSKYKTKNTNQKYANSKKLVKEVERLDEMATNPSGTYQTYGSNFSDQDSKVADLVN